MAGAFLKAFVVAAVAAAAVVLAPAWVLGAVVVVGVAGGIILVNTPKESVPSWLQGAKDAADGVAEEAVKVMEEGPAVLMEDIGQGFMDQIQTPEGIATVAGEVTGGLVGGWAGVKAKPKIKAKINDLKSSVKGAGGADGGKTLSNIDAEEHAFNANKGGKKADSVVLGKYEKGSSASYDSVAKDMDAQYVNLKNWDELSSQYSSNEIWKINEKFLDIQTSSGRDIYLSHNPAKFLNDGSYYSKEIQSFIDNGYKFVKEGDIWHAIR